jgi:hypothetical protein
MPVLYGIPTYQQLKELVNAAAFSASHRRGYRSPGISPEEHPGSTTPLTSLIQVDFGYGAGMDVAFECQDCGIFRSGRVA